MLQAVFLSSFAIIYFVLRNFRIKLLSIETSLIALVTFAPLLIHAVAWDSPRIWTYVVLGAFGCAWLWYEAMPLKSCTAPSLLGLLAFPALLLNILGHFPLMDGEVARFTNFWRVIFYAPLFIGAVFLLWFDQRDQPHGI
jgi:hypothetical protein